MIALTLFAVFLSPHARADDQPVNFAYRGKFAAGVAVLGGCPLGALVGVGAAADFRGNPVKYAVGGCAVMAGVTGGFAFVADEPPSDPIPMENELNDSGDSQE